MVPHATAKKVRERRSETREHVGQFYNIELSIGGFVYGTKRGILSPF